ncbi:SGNH/GDSL hydrolase family protein [Chitinimonas sp. BJB300]|uniref:SGNH/GDSL hydrolase family protein n=1 Tax=Chitinimonas sp. BJB300 TaxID=1559339 RepID=UPI000C0DCB86|nr:SGNH/GDSL hydrolase family protein [Chitinimonas sp. BJB300]PHV11465.1 thermolabile hemolysin [Chitinimonas sp. BJB300]TSJ87209.1 SGNH/GDSL hydrolase family protein [Chitinimonas sp. BJB300]
MKVPCQLLSALLLSPAYAIETTDTQPSPEWNHYLSPHKPATAESIRRLLRRSADNEVTALQASASNTYTYLRCYYLTGTLLRPTTTYTWALTPGSNAYYHVNGYWQTASWTNWENMFYSDTPQNELKSACEQTLSQKGINHAVAMWAAADNELSFNYPIWSIDNTPQSNRINKIIAFGDSLSDTQNLYNTLHWQLPNPNRWFLGRFSNGYTWVEYLARDLKLPLYSWAIAGAGAGTEKLAIANLGTLEIPGLMGQVQLWKAHRQKAPNYRPENTLFTVFIGGNDFINYNRSVEHVLTTQKEALQHLISAGARNILLIKLPNMSRAPIFNYKNNAEIVANKITDYNTQLEEMATVLKVQNGGSSNIQIHLFDCHTWFNDLLNNPSNHGMVTTDTSCLEINSGNLIAFLGNPNPRAACSNPNTFVFWDVLHPTTRTHQLLSERVSPFVRAHFVLATP